MKNKDLCHATSRVFAPFRRVAASIAFATALGFSASATAALETYEFFGDDTRLSGTFQFDDVSKDFGDLNISVNFPTGSPGEDFFSPSSTVFDGSNVFEFGSGLAIDGGVLSVTQLLISRDDFIGTSVGGVYTAEWAAIRRTETPEIGLTPTDFIGTNFAAEYDPVRTTFRVAAVPEPSTYAMMAIGLLGIAGMRRRQNKA